MRIRRGAVATSAGTLALVLVGGPLVAGRALAATPTTIVRPGDTLSSIALRYHTTVARLAALNRLRNPDLIYPGQSLVLTSLGTPGGTNGSAAAVTRIHVVRPGENLTGLAAAYGTSVAAIVIANHLSDPNRILVGQRLRIADGRAVQPASAAAFATVVHVVRVGENLTGIARHYRTSVAALVARNHLPNASFIRIGQRLLVAVRSGATAQAGWSTARFSAATQARMARRSSIRNLIVSEARRSGVPVPLALAVSWQESGWRQHVTSTAGAVGVMQVMPGTAVWIADAIIHAPVNIHNSQSNVYAGVALLKHYLHRYRWDKRRVLAAYYQGERAVDRYGIFPVSRAYIASILELEALFRP